MKHERIPNLFLENCEVLPGGFRNFAGQAGQYNKEGDRYFNIVVPNNLVQRLIDDGWNVRQLKPRDEDDEPRYRLNVAVSFKEFKSLPPTKVFLYSGRKRTQLTEETIATLDYAEYQRADLTIRPRLWTDEGEPRRIKAYLQEMHIVIQEHVLESYVIFKPACENITIFCWIIWHYYCSTGFDFLAWNATTTI